MSGKLIHKLKRKREEECSSNSSKNSSPAGSPLTTISHSSVLVNPSYSSASSSSTSTPSLYLANGNSLNSFPEYTNKPGTSAASPSLRPALKQYSSRASSQDGLADVDDKHGNTGPPDAKREKHEYFVDTPESSNDGAETDILPPTPPSEMDDQHQQHNIVPPNRNPFLVEALKRIVELQHELEDLDAQQSEEEDLEVSNIIGHNMNNPRFQQQQPQQQNLGAEALGFAVCARETLLFLQREGIPENSEIYRTLRDKLVGKSPHRIHI